MSTVLNVKIDPELKRQAQETAKSLGLPISTVVSAGLREFVRSRSITISDPPHLRPEVEAQLLLLSAQAHAGDEVSPAFTSVAEAFDWLDDDAD
ncbi:hypothetical protein [Pseudoclavibacter soli]|jgi:antitoxin component of RelBE/YafQ-DinJ toxin-antitoxin module|uniref:hypothetical protein n=1 Tax=Pseudoclavibacter soli TaxID=452623 RepID=UPI0003F7D94C|nr:hypothetical protein [Pseudoclavibacter soli]